jgi:glycosyltransferase involved in cell wall biosynthesis
MAREVPRTVESFLPPYQVDVSLDDIEIIVMENGSSEPVPESVRNRFPNCVQWVDVENPKPSPASALNEGFKLSTGEWVCPVIDGARMVTPTLLSQVGMATYLPKEPFITTLGFHLGHKPQQLSVQEGYNQQIEDNLLSSIGWPQNGERLFEISSLGLSALEGCFGRIAEANSPFLRSSFYEDLGGYDEAFDIPGGGIVNHDFYKRAVDHPTSLPILLLNDGSFHQHHGGVTTSKGVNVPVPNTPSNTGISVV